MATGSRIEPRTAFAPGRVNLIGEHVDNEGGHVLPMALGIGLTVNATPNGHAHDEIGSAQFSDVVARGLTDRARGHWADHAMGALQHAREQGWIEGGWTVTIGSTIPVGAGLSSSAATLVGLIRCLAPRDLDATEIARAAQRIENEFIGVPCGIMDQMAIAHATPGEALYLDCRTLEHANVAVPGSWDFAVVHSGERRELADGRYAERVAEMAAARRVLGLDYLCDAEPDGPALTALDPILQRRARHVASEDRRTMAAAEAMRTGDIELFAMLMRAGHASLRDDFEVSTPGIDALVADAEACGAKAARITGAGFGGCIVVLLVRGARETWWRNLARRQANASLIA